MKCNTRTQAGILLKKSFHLIRIAGKYNNHIFAMACNLRYVCNHDAEKNHWELARLVAAEIKNEYRKAA